MSNIDLSLYQDTVEYSKENARLFAQFAGLAYQNEDKIGKEMKRLELEWKFFFGSGIISDSQAFVAYSEEKNFIAISFRGTEGDNFKDWITDIICDDVDHPLGEVHRGFDIAYKKIADSILAYVEKLKKADHDKDMHESSIDIYICGHSLGGALATLCAADFISKSKPIGGVYTYGSPRVGDYKFSVAYNYALKNRTFRFINNKDLVTRLAPRILGYYHVGSMKYISSDGIIQDNVSWWNRFLDRFHVDPEKVLSEKGLSENFSDHSLSEYLKHL